MVISEYTIYHSAIQVIVLVTASFKHLLASLIIEEQIGGMPKLINSNIFSAALRMWPCCHGHGAACLRRTIGTPFVLLVVIA